ncbi:MAG: SMC-Scp complex subunit ScpB [Alphaproteobacteria bacterium]|nr:SMC-Scp complex subunit ScpB [Alphaproteobacteria bacterium]
MDFRCLRILEAVLFRAENPVDQKYLRGFIADKTPLEQYLQKLQNMYQSRGVHLVQRGTGWVFITAPDLHDALVLETDVPRKLSRAAMETLAIIAYYQLITRLEIEDIRGVSLARSTLDHLLDAGWITPVGHRQVPGRPTLWGTTTEFLHHFNLRSLHDLPLREELTQSGLVLRAEQGELFSCSTDDAEKTQD